MLEDQIDSILAALPVRISDIAKEWTAKAPGHVALVESSGAWTYGELASSVAWTRDWLVARGVRPGDRVVLVCENCRAFVALLLGLASVNAWPVLVNARLSSRELDKICSHCRPRLVVYTTSVSPHAMQHAKRNAATIEDLPVLGQIGFGQIDAASVPEPLETDPQKNVAALLYTSGSTGHPKGVMLTHGNLLFLAMVSATIRKLTPADRLYGVLPMSHAVGLSVVLLGGLASGATVYLSPRFDAIAARGAIERERITVLLGVPSTFAQLVEYAKLRDMSSLKFEALRIISSSGAPLDSDLKERVEELLGLPLHNGYGVTECSPTVAQANPEHPRADASVGEILPGTEVKLVSTEGKVVPNGEVGELWVRGPHVMKGYYRALEETAQAVDPEGWFNTRDLARLEGKNLFIVGRTKDLIVRFGFNVYPAEVEAVLNAHEDVVRSAVVGQTTDAGGGEEVIAFVQLAPGSSTTENDLASYTAQHLAAYKRPSQIFLVSEMPFTPTGKIAKAELASSLGL